MTTYRLFALTIFISSFLLFQIQPLISKHILPWFGGSSAVWITAMFFFMVMLAVGYGYALWLTRFRAKVQLLVHGLILFVCVTWLLYQKKLWSLSITPSLDQLNLSVTDPTLAIIFVLLLTIGLPFAILSSSSTLLQFWYARLSGQEPFSLYSISNIGSLLGLATFPFIVEPLFTTVALGQIWAGGFFVYVGLLIVIGGRLFKQHQTIDQSLPAVTYAVEPANKKLTLRWFFVASIPVLTMLAGTAFLTTTIAPVPLLWVGPLALYLLSFIISFRANPARTPAYVNEALVLVGVIIAVIITLNYVDLPIFVSITLILLAMFFVFHWCHEYLYATRPRVEQLPLFYMALALGGILGSVVMLISTNYWLELPIELLLIFVGVVLAIAFKWYRVWPTDLDAWIPRSGQVILLTFLASSVIVMTVLQVYNKNFYALEMARNFFGYKAALQYPQGDNQVRSLQHGMTNHGFQRLIAGEPVIEPGSYYGASSAVGKALAHKKNQSDSLNVVVLGLGAGSLAAYCRPTDSYEFIEIDPQVITLARDYFTYLDYCSQALVREGDGRLVLANKPPVPTYDLIILDAYADDMMPIHLMTKEALAIYQDRLKPDGIIAMNISSRYLELLPVTAALAEANVLAFRAWHDKEPDHPALVPSQWVLFAKTEAVFAPEIFSKLTTIGEIDRRVDWTDTYSALWPVVKVW